MKTDLLSSLSSSCSTHKTFFLSCIIFLGLCPLLPAQQLTGSNTISTPEASLFFLNPGYINPALGNGVLGMHSNPAGLRSVSGHQFSIALAGPQSSKSRFTFQLMDSNRVYFPLNVQANIQMKETGGIGAIGYAQQNGAWTWGVSMLQPRRSGWTIDAGGLFDINAAFQFDKPITKEMVPDLPVDEIPIAWDVNAKFKVDVQSQPAEIYLSILPIKAAVAVEKGVFALGAGLTYYHLSSGNDVGRVASSLQGTASVTGTPFGIDPKSNQPWVGTIGADVSFSDSPITALYNFQVSGHRYELSFGGVMNWGLLSLGASYSHGFKATLNGSYNITTIVTSGLPDEKSLSNIEIEYSTSPLITGHAKMDLRNFAKDTLSMEDNGLISMGGYNSFSLGLYFLGIGAFAGADVPQVAPDILSTYFGAYIDMPLPWLPIRVNAGGIYRSDLFMSEESSFEPIRAMAHIGGGVSIKTPFHRWFNLGEQHGWLRLGVRSSLASAYMEVIENVIENPEDKSLPNIFENLAMSLALEVPF